VTEADRAYVAHNDATRERLRAVLGRLRDDDYRRPLEGDWTVGAVLGHLAFWDRHTRAVLAAWARTGAQPPVGVDAVNEAALPAWRALPPAAAAREVLAAAELCDEAAARATPELVAAVRAANRFRLLDRGIHRAEHLDEIEQAIE